VTVANIPNLTFDRSEEGRVGKDTTFTFQVEDDGASSGLNQNLDASPNTMTINVTSVNDAPAGTDNTVTTSEDTTYAFAAAAFGFTDPNDSPANNFNRVKITTLPGAGTLKLSGSAVSAGAFVTVANIPNLTFD